jgi:ATP-dependent DNA helicase RecQ
MNDVRAALQRHFGHADFRPGQSAALAAILAGRNVLALMPTGAGKSLLYQLPAVLPGPPVIVVSPLISLMRDQIAQLTARGVGAVALHSALTSQEEASARALIGAGRARLIYVAPEGLDERAEQLAALRPRFLAVDEAHCVSRWGHDFRPDYLEIASAARALGVCQIVAVTATAAPATRADILNKLDMTAPEIFVQSFARPNLSIVVKKRRAPLLDALSVIESHRAEAGVFYCRSRAATERLARALTQAGAPTRAYHAGLDSETRAAHQDEFTADPAGRIAATIAFGMGLDKPDIRFVCHIDLPDSVESYYQEIGRAGRDGRPAQAIAFRPRRAPPPDEALQTGGAAFAPIAQGWDCRWRAILAALGETTAACGRCDHCQSRLHYLAPAQQAAAALRARARRALQKLLTRESFAQSDSTIDSDEQLPFPHEEETALSVKEHRQLERLRALRAQLARENSIAPRALCDEKALVELARLNPDDAAAQKAICARFEKGALLYDCIARRMQPKQP